MRNTLGIPAYALVLFLSAVPLSSWAQEPSGKAPQSKPLPAADREAEEDFLSRFSLDTSFQVNAGRYGGTGGAVFVSIPEELTYDHDGVVASLTVPYVIQRTRGNVVRVGGRVVRVGGKVQRRPKTDAGLGDILLDGGYYLLEAHDALPYLLVEGEVKFPTADDERGLGTSSYDESIRVSSGTTLWKHLKLSLDLGYGFIGQPEDIPSSVTDFKNTIYYGAGIGYKFNASNVLSLKLDGSTPIVAHTPSYDVVLLEYDHYFKNDSRLLISIGPGLTTSSPGISFEISYLFWF